MESMKHTPVISEARQRHFLTLFLDAFSRMSPCKEGDVESSGNLRVSSFGQCGIMARGAGPARAERHRVRWALANMLQRVKVQLAPRLVRQWTLQPLRCLGMGHVLLWGLSRYHHRHEGGMHQQPMRALRRAVAKPVRSGVSEWTGVQRCDWPM